MNAQIEVKEIDEETLKAIVEDLSKYPTEARFILIIETWKRRGESFIDEQRYEVLLGEVKEVVLEEWDSGYPYAAGKKLALIPLTVPVIIDLYTYRDDGNNSISKSREIFVFTQGWKSVKVY